MCQYQCFDGIWSDLSGILFFSLCIFCSKKDESFTEDGLDLHYWKHCPMLRRCDECRQVQCYFLFFVGTLLVLICPDVQPLRLRLCVQLCVVFTGSWDSQPHRAPTGWMWKQVQIQPVPALLRGCCYWRADSTCPGSRLQPWVLSLTFKCHWIFSDNGLCDVNRGICISCIFFLRSN